MMETEIFYTDFEKLGWGLPENRIYVEKLISGLSEERQKKIFSCKKGQARDQSLAAGLLLDYGLKQHGLSEKKVRIGYGKYGKPYLLDIPEIYFNLSHSGTRVMLVISGAACGCDIQRLRPAETKLPERFFTEKEAQYVRECPEAELQTRRFCEIWSLKESYIKMTGMGLKTPLNSFSVLPGTWPENCRFLSCDLEGYAAAVCLKTEGGEYLSFSKPVRCDMINI